MMECNKIQYKRGLLSACGPTLTFSTVASTVIENSAWMPDHNPSGPNPNTISVLQFTEIVLCLNQVQMYKTHCRAQVRLSYLSLGTVRFGQKNLLKLKKKKKKKLNYDKSADIHIHLYNTKTRTNSHFRLGSLNLVIREFCARSGLKGRFYIWNINCLKVQL